LFLIYSKAGRIAKANKPKAARLRSYKHNKAPSDVASLSPFASFVRQVRVYINDEEYSDKPGYDTYRALKDLWGMISDQTKKVFSEQAVKSRWKYVEHWEAWLRRKFCTTKPKQLLPNLPVRPKAAFRYFSEHMSEIRRQRKAMDEEYQLSPIPEIGEGVGILALVKNKKRKPGFFQNLSAEWKEMTDEKRKVFEDMAKSDEERYQREIKVYKEILENFKH